MDTKEIEHKSGIFNYKNPLEILFFINFVFIFILIIFMIFFSFLIHLFSIALILINILVYKKRLSAIRKISKYTKTKATLKKSSIADYVFDGGCDKFCPQIEYEYTVNKKTYQSDKVFFDSSYCKESYEECEDFLIDIVKNGLYIYYDPTNPFEAYVFNEYNLKNKIYLNGLLVCSGLLFLGIVYSCVRIFSDKRKIQCRI